jgi:RNA polymerase sigma-70 factor (ECF subfamily)
MGSTMTSPDVNPDEELLDRIGQGDQNAFAEMFNRYRPRLRRMVRLRLDRRLQGRLDASDVLHEAYVDLARHAADYARRPEMPFFLWLRMVTGQKLLEVHRRHLSTQMRDAAQEVSLYQGALPEADSISLAAHLVGRLSTPSQAAIRAEMQLRLQDVLNGLEPLDREILALRHFEELTNGEAAIVLGLTKAAASNRYVRALRRLKDELGKMPGFFE